MASAAARGASGGRHRVEGDVCVCVCVYADVRDPQGFVASAPRAARRHVLALFACLGAPCAPCATLHA